MKAKHIIALWIGCAGFGLAQPAPKATGIPIEDGREFEEGWLTDVDGDGKTDLLLGSFGNTRPRERRLDVHLRQSGRAAFGPAPHRSLRVPRAATAFALIDIGGDRGREVVFLSALGVHAPKKKRGYRKLLDAAFLWQLPDEDELAWWRHGVRDLDGDGLTDLLIPEPGQWRIALQRRSAEGVGSFPQSFVLRIPKDASDYDVSPRGMISLKGRSRRKSLEISLRTGSSEGAPRPLVEVVESVPSPQFADWDGDGDLDILARTVEKLHVWRQEPKGTFPANPSLSFPIPLVADKSRRLDISYSAHIADFNADRRADCLFVAGSKRSKNARSQVLVYVQGSKGRGRAATTPAAPLFGPIGAPFQSILLAGFAGFPRVEDIDGDGRADLSIATFRPDLIDVMRSNVQKSIELGWSVFLNRGGTFRKKSDLQTKLELSAKSFERARTLLLARFVPDVTGDRLKDVLIQDAPRRLKLFGLQRGGRGLALTSQPIATYTWGFDGWVSLPVAPGGTDVEVLVRGKDRVLHVRFD